ncbi:hypothetical protein GCM10009785_08770 [Brooklawnia cerclae]|uniref:Transcriptional regulator n=1 Tax=Brooklawnia cerclae TaxID=349934 RepID=A0ABX0SKI9_9ACTN|nr:helix-turn-helix domain-containing protein [Brooklawnia cerclae]NIH58454.1 putative transcriptional regulator [Brooklawnia cerclae]
MNGVELAARRIALGLTSQGRLADVLGVSQPAVSAWEKGTRGIPEGIDGEIEQLEEARDMITERMLYALELDPGAPLIVHLSDETWWAAHPECDGIPHEVQMIAAALAVCEADPRPPIVGVEALATVWRAPSAGEIRAYPGGPLTDLVAVREHGTRLALCWMEWRDGEPIVTLGVTNRGGRVTATTESTESWPEAETLVPRQEWPVEIRRRGADGAAPELRRLLDKAAEERSG